MKKDKTSSNGKKQSWLSKEWLLYLVLSFVFYSCEDFVEVDLPSNQLSSEMVFQDKATAEAALINIYAQMRDDGILYGGLPGGASLLGHYSDELVYYGTSTNAITDFYNNSVLPSNAETTRLWNAAYTQIYASNAVIEGVNSSSGLSASDKAQLTGEATFIRALLHFYLVNLYGDIPYVTTTDYILNSTISRQASVEVYQLIMEDLNTAFNLLPTNYIGQDRARANKAVAKALLARVLLYNGQYEQAIESASYLIDNITVYPWENDLSKVFLREASTTIWHFIPRNAGQNTVEGQTFILTAGPPSQTALSDGLTEAFEAGDLRMQQWIGTVSNDNGIWYYARKYKQMGTTPSSVEYSVVFRMAEQYLIRAEARARQGDLDGATADLNHIRNTAGLQDIEAQTAATLLDAILQERRVELFTEMGHRFFDLKRYGLLDTKLSGIKTGWDTTDALLPLPENELMLNPNLGSQNPGY
jgi:hypothetical protein